jgi:hypothetical protein
MLHNACLQYQNFLFKGTTGGYVHERLTGETTTRQQACYQACCLVAFKNKKSLNMRLYTVPETTLCGRLRTRCFPYLESDTFRPRFRSIDVKVLMLAACQTMEQNYLGPRGWYAASLSLSQALLLINQTPILTRFLNEFFQESVWKNWVKRVREKFFLGSTKLPFCGPSCGKHSNSSFYCPKFDDLVKKVIFKRAKSSQIMFKKTRLRSG